MKNKLITASFVAIIGLAAAFVPTASASAYYNPGSSYGHIYYGSDGTAHWGNEYVNRTSYNNTYSNTYNYNTYNNPYSYGYSSNNWNNSNYWNNNQNNWNNDRSDYNYNYSYNYGWTNNTGNSWNNGYTHSCGYSSDPNAGSYVYDNSGVAHWVTQQTYSCN
jgi:hypothetical protein